LRPTWKKISTKQHILPRPPPPEIPGPMTLPLPGISIAFQRESYGYFLEPHIICLAETVAQVVNK